MKIKMVMTNNYKLVPEGRRKLKITKSECTPSGKPNKWSLTFEDSEGGFVNNRFDFSNDKSKYAMAKFLEAVLGFEDGDEFDTVEDAKRCIGLEIYADIKHTEGTKLQDDGTPTIFANIDNKTIELANDKEDKSPRNTIIDNNLDL